MKKIEVIAYDPKWPHQYEDEARKIKEALKESLIEIHHIGSTSVPGLAAKKDLDILLVIDSLKKALFLQEIGYVFKGELNIPLRYFFSKNSEDTKVNLHVCEKDHGFIPLNLSFRNWLRQNNLDRDAYQRLKYKILDSPDARLKVNGIFTNYARRKDFFIKKILGLSGYQALTVNFCMHDQEWLAARDFRTQFFKTNDPYTWTFDHKDHQHIVLYKGIDIVGYAHVQLWADQRAALRIIAIDASNREQGYGSKLLQLIVKWLLLHDYKSIHTESSPDALRFYEKLKYIPMPFNDPDGYESSPHDIPMGKNLL